MGLAPPILVLTRNSPSIISLGLIEPLTRANSKGCKTQRNDDMLAIDSSLIPFDVRAGKFKIRARTALGLQNLGQPQVIPEVEVGSDRRADDLEDVKEAIRAHLTGEDIEKSYEPPPDPSDDGSFEGLASAARFGDICSMFPESC